MPLVRTSSIKRTGYRLNNFALNRVVYPPFSLSLSSLTNLVRLPLLRFCIHFWGVWYFCFTAISKGAEFQVFFKPKQVGNWSRWLTDLFGILHSG
ncbi:uncharacterized protein LOC131331429 isoform X3 [Rhododendron vialii]|uniref:uncharacterized protein LOC131331429 isoform X3 n=1 Tax=Rhododendron vialii TaxID=182163 RepID=UPI00265F4FD0|nr:uncharacterized protein LOC131331429 isoform X3 [Rhododendron vialii]